MTKCHDCHFIMVLKLWHIAHMDTTGIATLAFSEPAWHCFGEPVRNRDMNYPLVGSDEAPIVAPDYPFTSENPFQNFQPVFNFVALVHFCDTYHFASNRPCFYWTGTLTCGGTT